MGELEELARREQSRYHREWRAKNPDKVREANRRYWLKKAESLKAKEAENGKDGE